MNQPCGNSTRWEKHSETVSERGADLAVVRYPVYDLLRECKLPNQILNAFSGKERRETQSCKAEYLSFLAGACPFW